MIMDFSDFPKITKQPHPPYGGVGLFRDILLMLTPHGHPPSPPQERGVTL